MKIPSHKQFRLLQHKEMSTRLPTEILRKKILEMFQLKQYVFSVGLKNLKILQKGWQNAFKKTYDMLFKIIKIQ